eukprot:scaffold85737_cov56-Cyclotella_meneghiniana.AAC.7
MHEEYFTRLCQRTLPTMPQRVYRKRNSSVSKGGNKEESRMHSQAKVCYNNSKPFSVKTPIKGPAWNHRSIQPM